MGGKLEDDYDIDRRIANQFSVASIATQRQT